MHVTQSWYFRHALGLIGAIIPAAIVYTSMSCDLHNSKDRFYCFAIVVSLLGFCNFVMLRSHLKSFFACLVGLVLIVLLFIEMSCYQIGSEIITNASINSTALNSTLLSTTISPDIDDLDLLFSGQNRLRFEVIISVGLLLLLIVLLNYEFENSYRLSFNASQKAQDDMREMQKNKEQADWLLNQIIPAHLTEQFKTNRFYSHNHTDVGVIFATITNFNEFYDEMYAGGREYLRVLNELVSDYEVMLDEKRFKDVTKIKTINSCFMACSGLDEDKRAQNKDKYSHLYALMEFSQELQNVIEQFNSSIFNFDFILNIGYNYGPVTAGVIGTTKLLYDIWGDTVNIASRMYSTGPDNRIQVPEAAAVLMDSKFEFSYRDEISVKGKGQMKTYLLEKKRPGAHWE